MVTSLRTSIKRGVAVVAMISNMVQSHLNSEVATRSVFFAAWTAAILFGRSLHSWITADDDGCRDWIDATRRESGQIPDRTGRLARFRHATRRLALTELQQKRVGDVISRLQPIVIQLRAELEEKQKRLAALPPSSNDYIYETGCLSNEIGTLAAQLALTTSKLKTDVYTILTTAQQSVLEELQVAFNAFDPERNLNANSPA